MSSAGLGLVEAAQQHQRASDPAGPDAFGPRGGPAELGLAAQWRWHASGQAGSGPRGGSGPSGLGTRGGPVEPPQQHT